MTRHWWLTTQVIEVTHPARLVLVPTSGSNTVTEPWLPLLQHWFAYLHLTVSVLTCAGVWMIATLSKVTIPPTPGRLSTIHPSWDLSVVWQSTRVWWGSMVGELASTKLMSDRLNWQEKWINNTQIFLPLQNCRWLWICILYAVVLRRSGKSQWCWDKSLMTWQ